MRLSPLFALALAALAGCAAWPEPVASAHPAAPLDGTTWRLASMQSAEDSQGIARPGNVDLYTVTFDVSGTAYFRLDCNNGRGPWHATSTDATSGTLRFGPLGVTRKLCPAGSLGERLERQLAFVRTYLVKDGVLHMSLFADGGILAWEPTTR